EKTFIAWVGLRGAIPLYLALIPTMMGVVNGHYYFGVAFIMVMASLLVQGWTINALARKLGIQEDRDAIRVNE
ncbi:MAG: cation:proton antiporter, partial [Gemmataceae bacterium]